MEHIETPEEKRLILIGQLTYDFNEKARLERELAHVNDRITKYGRQYWRSLGYTVMPRMEKLRIAIQAVEA